MKLLFNKEENNDITVKMQKGTITVDFTYTEMISQLLEDNSITDTDFGNLSEDETNSLNEMLAKISSIFEVEQKEQSVEKVISLDEEE